ncbi:MAG: TetR/AcrR family transcriptional regulator [Sphingomonadales bacterium]|nr:TetR/AcrR family transcriptional regulator [Sphingomonadales bacterium]
MALSIEAREARRRNIIDAAHALIRETGGAGFSMLQLARHASVSPATPYNLLGSKSEVLRRVVEDEFASFAVRLSAEPVRAPLDRLLSAVDLVVIHYLAEPEFYRGLYAAMHGIEGNPLREMMSAQGQALWSGMVAAAIAAGEIDAFLPAADLTPLLLRTVAATVEGWLDEGWDDARFALEMTRGSRLLVLGLVSPERGEALRVAITAARCSNR